MGPGRQLKASTRTRKIELTGSRFGTASWMNCEFIHVDTFAFALSSSIYTSGNRTCLVCSFRSINLS